MAKRAQMKARRPDFLHLATSRLSSQSPSRCMQVHGRWEASVEPSWLLFMNLLLGGQKIPLEKSSCGLRSDSPAHLWDPRRQQGLRDEYIADKIFAKLSVKNYRVFN